MAYGEPEQITPTVHSIVAWLVANPRNWNLFFWFFSRNVRCNVKTTLTEEKSSVVINTIAFLLINRTLRDFPSIDKAFLFFLTQHGCVTMPISQKMLIARYFQSASKCIVYSKILLMENTLIIRNLQSTMFSSRNLEILKLYFYLLIFQFSIVCDTQTQEQK